MASIRKRPLKKRDGSPSGQIAWLLDFRDHLGRRRVRQFPTKREADAFQDYALAKKRSRSYVHHTETPTVREAVDLWREYLGSRVDAGARMEPATRDDYLAKLRLHFVPLIADIPVAQISTGMLRDLRDELLSSGRSPATTRKVLATLVQFFAFLTDRGLCPTNPATGVKLEVSARKKELRFPSRAQVRQLIEDASPSFRPLLLVSAFCGLRSSEARGLRWRDVDFDKKFIWVRQRVDQRGREGPPKTRAGSRKVPFGAAVSSALTDLRANAERADHDDLVFVSMDGTPLDHANILHRHWYPLTSKAGLKGLRWHDLRHFAVSAWIAAEIPIATVKEYAGHSSISVTVDVYGHLVPGDHPGSRLDQIEGSVLK